MTDTKPTLAPMLSTDLKGQTSMYAPKGAMMLPRTVKPLEEKEKPLPENHALGPRSAVTIEEYRRPEKKQRYRGEKMPPQYRPPFEEIKPKDFDWRDVRDMRMLVR